MADIPKDLTSEPPRQRVLVIDDDPAELNAVSLALEARDVEVSRLADPAKCLVVASRFQPHLVLLNLGTKKVGGRVVISGLRKEVRTRSIPIAVLSDTGLEEHLVHAFRWGVVDYLVKPFKNEDAERVMQLLKTLPLRTGRAEGSIENTMVDRLLSFFERTRKSGTLILNPGSDLEMRAVFSQGELMSCQVGQYTDREALSRMLAVQSGNFIFEETDELSADVLLSGETKVEVELPGQEDEGEVIAGVEILPEAPAPKGAPRKLLLVDDDEALIKLFSKVLGSNGFDVTTAMNGEEGFQSALDTHPEVIVADLAMPVLDGWGMLHRLRADHRVAETPVLFLSAHDDYRQTLQAMSAGAQDYISKTVKIDVLVKHVNDVLAPRSLFESELTQSGTSRTKVEGVGVQWSLARAAALVPKGTMSISDGWGTYDVAIKDGAFVAAVARLQKTMLVADEALAAVVAVRRGDLVFDVKRFPQTSNLAGRVGDGLARAAATNNLAEAAAADKNLVSASKLVVDPDLYGVYTSLGPPSGRLVAAQVSEGFSPREIISHTNLSPLEVEEILRDLIRRRVVKPVKA